MTDYWIELMDSAPDAGAMLLQALTAVPVEDSVFHHPLPTQARVHDVQCEYTLDKTWKCDTEHAMEALPPASAQGTGFARKLSMHGMFSTSATLPPDAVDSV